MKVGSYEYSKSTNPNKKLMVKVDNRTIHFGGNPNTSKHYFDKTGLLKKSLNHKDETTRKAWKARHGKIQLKDGSLAYKNPKSPAYHAWRTLW